MTNPYIIDVNEAGQIVGEARPYQAVEEKIVEQPVWFPVSHYIKGGVAIIILAFILFKAFFVVKQQTIRIIERFGRFKKITNAGLNFKIPLIDRIAGDLSLYIQEIADQVVVKSSDNAFLTIPVKVQFQVEAEKAKEAFYTLTNPKEQMTSYFVNIVRSEAAKMTMDEIFVSKNQFETAVKTELNERFGNFGYLIVNVLVDNPLPSEQLRQTFDLVIASQRKKEAATNEAEAIRITAVGKAQAEAQSLTLKAKAYVEQREIIAKGMNTAVEEFKKSGLSTEVIMNYLQGIDWRDTIRDSSNKGATVIFPADMSEIGKMVGALKSIK